MSSRYTHVPSLKEYLVMLTNTGTHEEPEDVQQLIDKHLATNLLVTYGPSIVFALDLQRKQYCYLSKNIEELTGYANDVFLKEGLDAMLKTRHADDVRLFSEVIFKQQLQFMHAQPVEEQANCWYTHNYRLQHKNGSCMQVLEQFTVIKSSPKCNPLILMGYCMDISSFKSDSKIVSTISKWNEKSGMQKISTESYSPIVSENRLSKREIEVLKWLMEGMSSQTISEKLYLSTHTVNTHRRNMLEKANAKNTADLIRFASQRGLV